jgi:hypothetical protein
MLLVASPVTDLIIMLHPCRFPSTSRASLFLGPTSEISQTTTFQPNGRERERQH